MPWKSPVSSMTDNFCGQACAPARPISVSHLVSQVVAPAGCSRTYHKDVVCKERKQKTKALVATGVFLLRT